MAAPRVFISSTYYDLKHVRNDIDDFIRSLGYTPVMHDRGGIAYTQTDTLENSCYAELIGCDIVICIIGNHFGSQASGSDYSITMEELRAAIKNKKKIYIFIAKDVYIENRTYLQNKDSGGFKPAYADNIKIHQFIEELKQTVKNNPIESFETTADIIQSLKNQFAGLFQNLLAREASLTEAKTAYDVYEATELFKSLLEQFEVDSQRLFKSMEGSLLTTNNTIYYIKTLLGMQRSKFIAVTLEDLSEFLQIVGFGPDESDSDDTFFKYSREHNGALESLTLDADLFEGDNWKLRRLSLPTVKAHVQWERWVPGDNIDDELPF